MADVEEITSIESWQDIWEAQAGGAWPLLIFKKSPICPTSFAAEAEFQRFVQALPETASLRICSVDVVGQRPVSLKIAEDTGISHQSPQALLVASKQNVLWHESHSEITQDSLSKAVKLADTK